jgi:hypothetical protein
LNKLGRFEEAVAAMLIAHDIYERQGITGKQIKVLLALSLILISRQDCQGAIYRLKQALSICHSHQLHHLELEVLHLLAHLFQKTGRRAEVEGCRHLIRNLLEKAR